MDRYHVFLFLFATKLLFAGKDVSKNAIQNKIKTVYNYCGFADHR